MVITQDFPELEGAILRRAAVGKQGWLSAKQTVEFQFDTVEMKLFAQKCPLELTISMAVDGKLEEIKYTKSIPDDFGQFLVGSKVVSANMIVQEPGIDGPPLPRPVRFKVVVESEKGSAAALTILARVDAAAPQDFWEARLALTEL